MPVVLTNLQWTNNLFDSNKLFLNQNFISAQFSSCIIYSWVMSTNVVWFCCVFLVSFLTWLLYKNKIYRTSVFSKTIPSIYENKTKSSLRICQSFWNDSRDYIFWYASEYQRKNENISKVNGEWFWSVYFMLRKKFGQVKCAFKYI